MTLFREGRPVRKHRRRHPNKYEKLLSKFIDFSSIFRPKIDPGTIPRTNRRKKTQNSTENSCFLRLRRKFRPSGSIRAIPEGSKKSLFWLPKKVKNYNKKDATILDLIKDTSCEYSTKLYELNIALTKYFPPLEGDIITFIGLSFINYGIIIFVIVVILELCKKISNDHNEFSSILICVYTNDENGILIAKGALKNPNLEKRNKTWLALYSYNPVEGIYFDSNPGAYLGSN